MKSEIEWVVLGLAPIGEVQAPDITAARAEAERVYGWRAEQVQSKASYGISREDQAIIDRNRRLRSQRLAALASQLEQAGGVDLEDATEGVDLLGAEASEVTPVPGNPVDHAGAHDAAEGDPETVGREPSRLEQFGDT